MLRDAAIGTAFVLASTITPYSHAAWQQRQPIPYISQTDVQKDANSFTINGKKFKLYTGPLSSWAIGKGTEKLPFKAVKSDGISLRSEYQSGTILLNYMGNGYYRFPVLFENKGGINEIYLVSEKPLYVKDYFNEMNALYGLNLKTISTKSLAKEMYHFEYGKDFVFFDRFGNIFIHGDGTLKYPYIVQNGTNFIKPGHYFFGFGSGKIPAETLTFLKNKTEFESAKNAFNLGLHPAEFKDGIVFVSGPLMPSQPKYQKGTIENPYCSTSYTGKAGYYDFNPLFDYSIRFNLMPLVRISSDQKFSRMHSLVIKIGKNVINREGTVPFTEKESVLQRQITLDKLIKTRNTISDSNN